MLHINPYYIAKYFKNLENSINKLLPNKLATFIYSYGRVSFLKMYKNMEIKQTIQLNPKWERTLWGLKFQQPIFNGAGMFKNGECYDLTAHMGAGAYLGGTSTINSRVGNKKNGIKLPFVSLHKSKMCLNSLGLPNLGDEILGSHNITKHKNSGCPIGWSIARSLDIGRNQQLESLVKSLWLYHDNELIDFVEINESCPNITGDFGDITYNLQYISKHFLSKRKRLLPIIIKVSNDTSINLLPQLIQELIINKFDGINLGNTSTNYNFARNFVAQSELELFDYFVENFGGGISGYVLKQQSLLLCKIALDCLNKIKPDYEFHPIRCGGIDSIEDIIESENAGIQLNQWYTGYFNNFAKQGTNIYASMFG